MGKPIAIGYFCEKPGGPAPLLRPKEEELIRTMEYFEHVEKNPDDIFEIIKKDCTRSFYEGRVLFFSCANLGEKGCAKGMKMDNPWCAEYLKGKEDLAVVRITLKDMLEKNPKKVFFKLSGLNDRILFE